jgi:Domain of unknown function (DUF5666)
MKSLWVTILSLALGFAGGACAQTSGAAGRAQLAGTITSIDSAAKRLSVKTDKGEATTVETTDHTFFRRMPPGESDTKKAVAIALSDITAGDRMVAIGQPSADQKNFEARTIYIMTKSDVAEVHQKEMEDWQKRGTVGNVASIDAGGKAFTIKVGSRVVTVQQSDKTEYLRYALDSAKITDAKPSAFAQIKVGDQAHVLGNKNAEGTTVTAEEVVFGSFKQIAATVESVDPQTGELRVKDLAVKKGPPVILKITPDTTIKKLPPQLAAMLARRYAPGAQQAQAEGGRGGGQGGPGGPGAGGPGGQGGPGGFGRGPGSGGMRGGGGGSDIQRMLESIPATPLSDLKPGDAIMVSTTEGNDSTHLTAIMLLAGVEPVLTAAPNSTRDIMSGWNLGGGGGGDQ